MERGNWPIITVPVKADPVACWGKAIIRVLVVKRRGQTDIETVQRTKVIKVIIIIISIIIIIYPLTARVVGAPEMISQPVSSIFSCSPLPSGTWRTPGLSILWCCLPNSSSVCLVFVPLSLCLARWFWPDLMNGRHVHTTAVCVSLRWCGGLRVVRLPAEFWHGLPCPYEMRSTLW